MRIHVADFDNNGAIDPIVSYYIQGESYPMASRDQLLDQIPLFRKKYIRYADYADASLAKVFEPAALRKAETFECVESKTILLLNEKNLSFKRGSLPVEAQFSATNSILSDDYDRDGITDLLLFGNFFPYRPELGENDASMGLFFRGVGDAKFDAVPPGKSGLFADGDVRQAVQLNSTSGKNKLVVSKNDQEVQIVDIRKE
jgi:hypothetical protein